ncbi:MAG: sulfatase [Candidatus Hermodarchaeota archaeon]
MIKRTILITIDCWRLDRLGIFGYNDSVLPNINKLSNNASTFENMIANSSNTAPSFYALFMSKIPVIDGQYSPLPSDQKQFTEILRENKIKTCGIHSNPHLGKLCNYNKGFDDFFDMFEEPEYYSLRKNLINRIYKIFDFFGLRTRITKFNKKLLKRIRLKKFKPSLTTKKINYAYSNAKDVTRKAIDWISKNYKSNFFLWIHYMDAHRPYFPPDKFIKRVSNREISESKKLFLRDIVNYFKPDSKERLDIDNNSIELTNTLYDAELNYVDYYIGILLEYLKHIKIFSNVNLILTADHGEAIFEHGFLGHQISLYDELLKIPLIVRLANNQKTQNLIKFYAELIDVAPTILDTFNITSNKNFRGKSLIPLMINADTSKKSENILSALLHHNNKIYSFYRKTDESYFLMISTRTKNWKLIFDEQTNDYELYNLTEDPKELTNLYYKENMQLEEIKQNLLTVIKVAMEKLYNEKQKIKRVILKNISKFSI